jgi:glucose-6-phosphate 1-dehydrogenase
MERISYLSINFEEPASFESLKDHEISKNFSLYYLATPPKYFAIISHSLNQIGLITPKSKVVVEKPIGENYESSVLVNNALAEVFKEKNIYRIDHYLGKETVQNLLALRFANHFIYSQWDRNCIDHVQITVGETVGLDGRWSYYDKIGQLRDMVQNHLMQLLCLVAMEPPASLHYSDIQSEKLKVIRALRKITDAEINNNIVIGQYDRGWINGSAVAGYLQEPDCGRDTSDTETYIAIKTYVDNWRWSGVPFYLRTGKRLPEKVTEISIQYKEMPHKIFESKSNLVNTLKIRLQPNEGIEMSVASKRKGIADKIIIEPQTLNLNFDDFSDGTHIPDAYERLLFDAIHGDSALFVSREEVEASWLWCDQIIRSLNENHIKPKIYQSGTWGPATAELLMARDGRSWFA